MKKILYAIVLTLIVSISAQAQVDRSVQPKPGPAPKINLGKPQTFKLDNGLTVMVVENHKLPRVSFTLRLDNPPVVEGNLVGTGLLTSQMVGNGTSKISKDEFNERIDYYGASVNFGAGSVSGSTLSRYFSDVLSLAAQGCLDPLLTQEDLDSEKAKLLDGLKSQEKSASYIAQKVSNALVYGKSHPKGEFETEATISNVTLKDVKDFYSKNFVPENAYLVIIGDVKFDDVKKQVTKDFAPWKKASAPKSIYSEPVNLTQTEINFVDVPSAVQSEVYLLNVVDLKMTSPDYFAATLANQILGGGGEGRLFLNLREAHGWTYGSYSGISGSKDISNFKASASVRNSVADSAVVELLSEVNKIRTELPTQAELDLAKAKYVGNFIMNAEKPQTIASFALMEKTQSLPANFYADFIKNINDVTLEQVRAAAQKYFLHNGSRILIVGKASEILPNLDRLNIPVKYFDRDANPTEKPTQEVVSADVTAQTVLNDYIAAIGGMKAAESVKTLMTISKGSIQGQELTLVQKSTADGKSAQEMSVMGMTLTKAVFDGQKGYITMQGNKKDLGEAEIAELKYSVPVSELLLLKSDIQLKGVEEGNYVLELGDKTYYYNKDTHLKVAESVTKEVAPGNNMTQKVNFGDYREVSGVKIPHKTSMNVGMDIELNVVEAKINEGVTDADFQ